MLATGVEILTRGWSREKQNKLEFIRPQLVKLRWPNDDIRYVLDLPSQPKLILRPPSEGWTAAEMRAGATAWYNTLCKHDAWNCVHAFEPSNEPNHPNNHATVHQYYRELTAVWSELEDAFDGRLCRPGLTPHVEIGEWSRVLDADLPWDWYGIHCYFQYEGGAEGARIAIAQAPSTAPDCVLATEVNCGHPWPGGTTQEERIRHCYDAFETLHEAGVAGAVLFAHDTDHPCWNAFVYPIEDQRSILHNVGEEFDESAT